MLDFILNSKNQTVLNVHLLLDPTTRQIVILRDEFLACRCFPVCMIHYRCARRLILFVTHSDHCQCDANTRELNHWQGDVWPWMVSSQHPHVKSFWFLKKKLILIRQNRVQMFSLVFINNLHYSRVIIIYMNRSKVLLALCGKDKKKDFCASAWPIRVTTSDNRST